VETERKSPSEDIYHDKLSNFMGSMTLTIKALSPLFVGTGDYEIDEEGLYQPFFRREGRIVIPGTSVKGVVRSYAEALSPSCEAARCKEDSLCPCCAIFGKLGFQGRVSFMEAEPQDPNSIVLQKLRLEIRWPPEHDGERKFYKHEDHSAWERNPPSGERLETVKASFKCDVYFYNLKKSELGLLLLAMGISSGHPFNPKLGGGKNRGLGSIRFSMPDGIKITDTDGSYHSFGECVEEKTLGSWGEDCVREYLQSLSEENRNKILNDILPSIQNSGTVSE
jgi:CRISPR/Cas system CSM-associated protein Csm3 (group 7 of RAMP superfamily)